MYIPRSTNSESCRDRWKTSLQFEKTRVTRSDKRERERERTIPIERPPGAATYLCVSINNPTPSGDVIYESAESFRNSLRPLIPHITRSRHYTNRIFPSATIVSRVPPRLSSIPTTFSNLVNNEDNKVAEAGKNRANCFGWQSNSIESDTDREKAFPTRRFRQIVSIEGEGRIGLRNRIGNAA